MNKEEILNKYIDLIDKGYCSDCNELNCIDNFPYAKITHAIRELQQENQELKSQLKGTTHCFDEEEHEKLKKQLEELKEEKQEWINLLDMFKNQQKEFINYLEDYLKLFDKMDIDAKISYDMIEEILQKYRSIIGSDE